MQEWQPKRHGQNLLKAAGIEVYNGGAWTALNRK
jgi:hypothetical protein